MTPTPLIVIDAGEQCWNRIGVRGDRSCPELVQYTHCNNCPVFAAEAVSRLQQLCHRPTPRKAGREWQCRFGNKAARSPSNPSRIEGSGRPTLRPPTGRAPWSLSCGRET